MYKIMPVNRIATAEDLRSLQDNIPYSKYKERAEKNPKQAVEKVKLVCMGHEPDLGAKLIAAYPEFKLEVEVLDIFKDRNDLKFKMDSEARINFDGKKLKVEDFYPRNLLQKASLHEGVDDWRKLVDVILIDWDYNGEYMRSPEIDSKDSDGYVSGEYTAPEDVGSLVKIKIVDLLSESFEQELLNAK
jgi:hypothetical protein